MIISTKKPVELLNRLWASSTPTQKKALLKARGLSTTWSKAKTIKEMVSRGGGSIAKDLLHVVKTYGNRNQNIKRVIFKK